MLVPNFKFLIQFELSAAPSESTPPAFTKEKFKKKEELIKNTNLPKNKGTSLRSNRTQLNYYTIVLRSTTNLSLSATGTLTSDYSTH